jgi:hypothetical protein
MSNKLLMTFLFLFVGISLLAAVMQGGGGIVSTVLTENINATATYIPAASTSIFAGKDIIRLGNEKILYSSKNSTGFIAQTRGYSDTVAETHEAGRRIYSEEAGVLNDAMGFNMAVEIETSGTWGIVTLPINFFIHTLPHLVMLNVNFLKTPELSIIGIFWFAAGIALLVTIAIAVAPIAISMATGVLGLIRR